MKRHISFGKAFPVLIIVLIIIFLVSAVVGRFPVSVSEIFAVLGDWISGNSAVSTDSTATVLLTSRFPRILVAALIGCGLAVSGASYQGMFRNPMASSDLLGASAGAGFGAALGLILGLPTPLVHLIAFAAGLISVFITLSISRLVGGRLEKSPVLLILSGIVVAALFQAFISIIKYVADPFDDLPSISFWLMGGLTYVTASDILYVAIPVVVCTVILLLIRYKINLLAFGSEEAKVLGLSVKKYRIVLIICATLMTSSCVAVGGMIGWVGLIIPHFARMLVGPDYKKMLPCAVVMGAGFLLLVDDISRSVFAQDLPIGILTAIIGAPVFVFLLAKGHRGFI